MLAFFVYKKNVTLVVLLIGTLVNSDIKSNMILQGFYESDQQPQKDI